MCLFAFWIINFGVPQIFHITKSVPCLQKGTAIITKTTIVAFSSQGAKPRAIFARKSASSSQRGALTSRLDMQSASPVNDWPEPA